MRPFISIVVPVFNDAEMLRVCLGFLSRQSFPRSGYEVIVVDNGSTDDVASVVAEFEGFILITETRVGSYAARNRGVKESRGTIIGFTDAICKPDPDWISKAVSCFEESPETSYLAGRTIFEFRNPEKLTRAEVYQWVNIGRAKEHLEDYGFAACANLFARRELFEVVGPFDEELLTGGDFEWGRRVREAGIKQGYCPDSIVLHPSRTRVREVTRQEARRFDGIYLLQRRKNPTLRGHALLLLFALFYMPGWRRVPLDRIRRLRSPREVLQYFLVSERLRWVRVAEYFRLLFGGTPLRK